MVREFNHHFLVFNRRADVDLSDIPAGGLAIPARVPVSIDRSIAARAGLFSLR
jgi:hypothetical protein